VVDRTPCAAGRGWGDPVTGSTTTGLDLAAIGHFLREHGVAVDGELSARMIEGGRSNLTYLVSDASSRWVLRRPPTGAVTRSAHDVAREFQVMRALEQTEVPVARTVALCRDAAVIGADFTVVEYVEGATIRTQANLDALDEAQVAACAEGLVAALAALHRVDHRSVGLEKFGRSDAYASRQLRTWSGQWGLVASGPSPLAEQLLRGLLENVPVQGSATIVHGDYRVDNTIVDLDDPGPVRAIVDWELSTIGDPVADVAMMCAYRHPGLDLVLGTRAAWTSPRLPSVDDLAGMYEAISGIRLDHWEFYLGLSYYKLAVIAEGINHRYQQGVTVGEGFDGAGESVTAFLEAGLRHVAGHRPFKRGTNSA
jgi:aminoglycoside phosphotransferase (APT) family kinase protein